MNWSGPNCDFLPKWITFGPDQFILVVTISFWSWPNHYGQVQINLVRPKPFWTDQNCFGHIEGQGIKIKSSNSAIIITQIFLLPYCFTKKKKRDWRHVFVSLQSMSATSGGSSSFVRLSDNEISKILSIPMSLVSENCSQREQSAQVQSEQAKNPNVNVSSAGSLCDNTQRNLLHLNKVVTYSMFTFVCM